MKKTIKHLLLSIALIAVTPVSWNYAQALSLESKNTGQHVELSTIYGKLTVTEPVVIELLNSSCMQRLKHVDQHGTFHYFSHVPSYSRYDHCIGVYFLLNRFGASFKEQIAGLLHDASHTAFSHVGDVFFKKDGYQDSIHEWFLNQTDVPAILKKYNLTVQDILPENEGFRALEQNLPGICADRLEYNLHTAYLYNMFSQQGINQILENLCFENGQWFFTDAKTAALFARPSLYFTEKNWGSHFNSIIYHWTSQMLQRAIELKLISQNDIHFGYDKDILAILEKSNDSHIKTIFKKCNNYEENHALTSEESKANLIVRPKFRGIDPLVKVNGHLKRLTELDAHFKEDYETTKQWCSRGTFAILDETEA